jgi:hypothetical protein
MHPGQSLVIVTAGTLTDYERHDPECRPHLYTKGMGFVDPGGEHVHNLRKEGDVVARTIAVQFIPADAARRILTSQIPGPVTSTGDELIQRSCERSRMWIGIACPEIVNTQADQYRPVFTNPVHLDVKPAYRTSDPESRCGR